MICAIHQPQYLPWLGYFDKLDKADVFVFLDNVQYKKNEWQNRNKIRTARGWQWITVPVRYNFKQLINQVRIDNSKRWSEIHYHSLLTNYNKAPYFNSYSSFFKNIYSQKWEYLVDINIYFIKYLTQILGITTELIKASQLDVTGQKTVRLVNICKKLGADTYLSGSGAREYLDLSQFEKNNIKVVFQQFHHPVYKQVYPGFELCMSIVDLLFNYGHKSLAVLRGEAKVF